MVLPDIGKVTLGCGNSMLNSALLVDIVAQGFRLEVEADCLPAEHIFLGIVSTFTV